MSNLMNLIQQTNRIGKPGKESIHSGQFMVSQFEAEEQDDEDNLAVPIPEVIDAKAVVPLKKTLDSFNKKSDQLGIEHSLTKLFQCMSLAYRQKLTSPKWNRFRGIRLRWKDKIRLNNVIWRCWHLQFIKKENTLICQFASPLDVDTHNKPEAIVLEGKYWKRKLAAVTAEYKKWRMFYRNHLYGHTPKEDMDMINDVDAILGDSNSMDTMNMMMIDEDYMGLMSDTLFSTITNQPFAFPDTRELARSGFADFIQPSLGPLQPNLDDYMDTFDPIQELYTNNNKLPTVPEEHHSHAGPWQYSNHVNPTDLSVQVQVSQVPNSNASYGPMDTKAFTLTQDTSLSPQYALSQLMLPSPSEIHIIQNSNYPIIPKLNPKSRGKYHNQQLQPTFSKPMEATNTSFQHYNPQQHSSNDRIHVSVPITKNCSLQESQGGDVAPSTYQEAFRTHASSQGYKFSSPGRPTIKFSPPNVHQQQQQVHNQLMQQSMHASPISYQPGSLSSVSKEKEEQKINPNTLRGRGRSRSNTRDRPKRPPLISAVSDPALITPQTNVLLTQLLTTNSPLSEAVQAAYNQNQTASSNPDLSQTRRIKEEGSNSLSSQITVATVALTNGDTSYLNTYSGPSSPLDSPSQNLHSPTSSQGSIGSPGRDGSNRDRRVGHIHAEQKRRCNIKYGFDMLHSLIPQLNQNPNAKLAKAALLQKGAEYIRQLITERNQLREEMESLRQQIESLNTSISNCQSMLPATGAPVSRRRDSRMQEMFDEYVVNRTMDNWKFWIFSLICRPLLNSFNNFVSTSSLEDLYSSTCLWVEQHCTLVDLRPVVLNSLRYLCTKTEILTEPEKLPEEARQLVLKKNKK